MVGTEFRYLIARLISPLALRSRSSVFSFLRCCLCSAVKSGCKTTPENRDLASLRLFQSITRASSRVARDTLTGLGELPRG